MLDNLGGYQPDFSETQKWFDDEQEERIKNIKKKERKEDIKFWVAIGISLIALGVSIYTLRLQYEQGQQKPKTQIIRDTVPIAEPLDSPKSELSIVDDKDSLKNSKRK
jgi:hypothetical protein